MKTCSKCKKIFPATPEFFNRDRGFKDGLRCQCKECVRQRRQETSEQQIKRAAKYRGSHRESLNERQRQRRTNDDIKRREAEYNRQYRQENPEKHRAKLQRRRARKRNLPNTFTGQQWERCLEYFNHCCAVCGIQLRDLFGNIEPHADHWIPLASEYCLGSVAENTVCLCNNCNLTKHAIMPTEWLERKFGKRKAKQILERIEAYFDWVKSQDKELAA